jgi:hypothetical protein
VNLHPRAREYYALEIVTDPPVPSWDASFDDGVTWVAGTTTDGVTRWLVAGPDANPTGATVLAKSVKPLVRATSNPEIVVRHSDAVYLG